MFNIFRLFQPFFNGNTVIKQKKIEENIYFCLLQVLYGLVNGLVQIISILYSQNINLTASLYLGRPRKYQLVKISDLAALSKAHVNHFWAPKMKKLLL